MPNICSSLLWWLGFTPGLPRIGKSEDRGAVRVRSREVFRGGKSKAPPLTRGRPAVHWQIDVLVALPAPHAGVVALRQTFVFRCHGGLGSPQDLPRIGKSEHDGGQPRSERVKFSGAAKVKPAAHLWLTRRSSTNRRFNRPSPRAGLVAPRQTFVRRCHGGWTVLR